MTDRRLTKLDRVRRPAEYRHVYDRRRSVSNGRMTLAGCENGLDRSRLGLSVSRKVGPAVVRNRWKRLLREAFRLTKSQLPSGLDLVVIPRDRTPPDLIWLLDELPRMARQVQRRLAKP